MRRNVAPFAGLAEYHLTCVWHLRLWLAFGAQFEVGNSVATPPVRLHFPPCGPFALSHSEAVLRTT